MKNLLLSVAIFCFLLTSCDSRKKEFDYFQDGKTLKRVTEFNNGIKDGLEVEYYKSGKVRSNAFWIKGKKEGVFKQFFESGNLAVEVNYHNNRRVGDMKIYRSTGQLHLIEIYDSLGELIDYREYNLDGSRNTNPFPLTSFEKDTVRLGDSIRARVRLGNTANFGMMKGYFIRTSELTFDKDNNPDSITDTLNIVYSDQNIYRVNFRAEKLGENFFKGQIFIRFMEDSIMIASVTRPFYVRP
jgi:hypothetical protein